MPRRYGADGTRLWNGKTPEEFTEADAYRFMAETEAVLQRKELMDDPAQPAPASGKEEFYLSKKDDVLLTPEQIAAEERRWLFDAPIAELAEVKGVSIDEAVKMRTNAVLQEAVVPITVSVRPIEPQGKLIGFASVNFGGVVIDDFKVVDGKNGIFLGAPSKPDPASRTGYRATVRIPDRATQERINAAGVEAYQKSPVYNPQFTYGKPYTRVHSRSGTSSNYGKFERQGSESNDGRRYPGNVLFVPTVSGGIHPTQKPVELCEYLIRTYTRPGELVADICAGSGTTAIAAINTERRFVCFETAPAFYAAASERIRAAQAVKSSGEKGV